MTRSLVKPETVLDADALTEELVALYDAREGGDSGFRKAMLARLKQVVADGRARIEAQLAEDGRGELCARRLSAHQDQLIRALYRFAVRRLFPADNPSAAEGKSVIAVGGYGRGTLAPGSDIDLMFLLPYKQTPWGESIVESLLYTLWDLGFKVGHATRTIDECIRLARGDMTIRTAVLDGRRIVGDEELFDEFSARFDREIISGSAVEFITAKLAERDERHARTGESRYLVEPNIKESKGGQRDLHTLYWLARYVYRVDSFDALVEEGVFTRSEVKLYRKSADFLWAIRCHLHFMAGRAEERLSFEVQADLAARLGYMARPGLRPVERFMKHYFLVAKDVGDLTRILCAALEVRHFKKPPVLSRLMTRFRRKRHGQIDETGSFGVDNNRLNVTDDLAFERDPTNLMRLFYLCDRMDLALHPDTLRLARGSLRLIDARFRENLDANQMFLDILTSKRNPERVLRRMNEAGVLGRFVREFGRVVSMMQFNLYHHYTVDEHLIRSIGILSDIEQGRLADSHPLATELMQGIGNRKLLYVTMFLHDIAKGRPEDHSVAGARIARRFCPRLGFTEQETETVAWLIEEHLTMSKTAQSRDLQDPRTISDFAELVQSPERLKLLLILTTADITAVGPGVFNGWKAQLLATLYHETATVLDGGHGREHGTERIADAQASLRAALSDWSDDAFARMAGRHFPAYWLNTDLDRQIEHAELMRQAEREDQRVAIRTSVGAVEGATRIAVLAPDHPRLLSMIAGSCAALDGNIVDALVFTTTDGIALDSISLERAFPGDDDELRRADRIADLLRKAIAGEAILTKRLDQNMRAKRRTKPFRVATEVLVSNAWSDQHTLIEASGLDRPGLLYDLTGVLSDLNLNIASAHIATFGARAVDVFYVTDLTGGKIVNGGRQSAIKRRLTRVFEPAAEKAA